MILRVVALKTPLNYHERLPDFEALPIEAVCSSCVSLLIALSVVIFFMPLISLVHYSPNSYVQCEFVFLLFLFFFFKGFHFVNLLMSCLFCRFGMLFILIEADLPAYKQIVDT